MEAIKVNRSYKRPLALRQEGAALTEITGKSVEELQTLLSNTAGTVKVYIGVVNNAVWYQLVEAIDTMKREGCYKHQVKALFNLVLKKWREYENRLIYAEDFRYFSVDDMPDYTRKKYGNITNRQYYDYWQASGGEGYTKAKNDIGCLKHKYYKSLDAHGVPHADSKAAVLVTMAMLEGAAQTWRTVIDGCCLESKLPKKLLEKMFKDFKLDDVKDAFEKAMKELTKNDPEFVLTAEEDRNIAFGIEELFDKLSDLDFIYSSQLSAVEAYDDVFRTKGEWKKQQRLFAEAKKELLNDIKTA